MKKLNSHGFTLIETMVTVSLFVLIIIMATSAYSSVQRAYVSGANRAETSQNLRVAMDRISREIRQTPEIITPLSASSSNATSSITFQDGHDSSQISYIKYYHQNGNLLRETSHYFFNAAPAALVRFDSVDIFGNIPTATTTSSQIVGEYVSAMDFWGSATQVNLQLTISKNGSSNKIQTIISPRN